MSIRLNYQLDGYHIKADVDLPEGRVRAADLLPVHREVSDAVSRAVIATVQDAGQAISCHKGCSACCKRLYVEVTEAEAYRLSDTIRALPGDHQKRVESRYTDIREKLIDAGLYDAMLNVRLSDDDTRHRLSVDYYQQGIACPFLENDACSIYTERPLACREYLVTSNVEECTRPKQGGVSRVCFPWPTVDHAMRMTRSTYDDVPLVPLSLLPSWLDQYPEPAAEASGFELLMRAFSGLSFQLNTASDDEGDKGAADMKATAIQGLTKPIPDIDEIYIDREVVADYVMPDALMVPHYGMSPIGLMEDIASAAAESIGVILLTPDPERTQAFIDRQPEPERFTMVTATSDTGWIQDRAPIPVRGRGGGMEWYLPRLPEDGRGADASLFEMICAHPTRPSPLTMARGNLVIGPGGLALSSNLVFDENLAGEMQEMRARARQLGINRWIVFTPFTEEPTRHADVHVRFLSADLAAVAWSQTSQADRQLAEDLERQLKESLHGISVLRIPMRSEGTHYASPLNWIQLGTNLIVPHYELTQEEDIEQIKVLLTSEGYNLNFIESPTLDTGGSLHCLTASIYL